ncbi:MAG: hypothetical protein Cons2KO_04710 [Congregibacter sp.]
MRAEAKKGTSDGRRLRSERSRQSIIAAAIALMDDGVLVPTAQQISDRAGVGMRTFFRHFADMESLFVAVNDFARQGFEAPFRGGDRTGSLEERIDKFVRKRADGYDTVAKVMLSTQANMWRSKFVRKSHEQVVRDLRADLERWLPEAKDLTAEQRQVLDAVSSFDMWNRLRQYQKLGKRASTAIVRGLVAQVFLQADA